MWASSLLRWQTDRAQIWTKGKRSVTCLHGWRANGIFLEYTQWEFPEPNGLQHAKYSVWTAVERGRPKWRGDPTGPSALKSVGGEFPQIECQVFEQVVAVAVLNETATGYKVV